MRIRDLFFRNFWWKLASVVLATLIWFNWFDVYSTVRFRGDQSVSLKLDIRTLKDLPVVPIATDSSVKHLKTTPPLVTLRLEGEWDSLIAIDPGKVHVWVFVTDPARAAGTTLPVEVSGLPPGISVLSIDPDKVAIESPSDH